MIVTNFSQLSLNFGKGNLEGIFPWGAGTFVCKSPPNKGFASRDRTAMYFDQSAKKVWENPIKCFNTSNRIVVDKQSKFAYLINLSFVKSNASENSSDTEPLRINRLDQAGTVKEIIINEAQLKPIDVKRLARLEFGFCTESDLFLMFSVNDEQDRGIQEFTMLKLKEDGSIVVKKIDDLKLLHQDWANLKNSHPKYIHHTSESMYFIQNKFESGAMLFLSHQLDLNDLSIKKTIHADLVLNNISGLGESKGISSFHEDFGPTYEYNWQNDASNNSYPTLEAFYSSKVSGTKLQLYGNIYEEKNCTGIWAVSFDLNGGTEQLPRPETLLFADFPDFPMSRNKLDGPITSMNMELVDGKLAFCVHNSKDFKYYCFVAGKMTQLTDQGVVSTSIPLNQQVFQAFKDQSIDPNAAVYIYNKDTFWIYVVLDGTISAFQFD